MKVIITLLLLCTFSGVALAQDAPTTDAPPSSSAKRKSGFVIKPGAGINVTDFSKDPASGKSKGRVGWQAGLSAAVGSKVYIEPGIFYVQKSSKFVSDTASAGDIKFDISGIRIPVAVGVHLLGNPSSFFSLRAFGGGSAFFVMNADDADEDDFESPSWGLFAGAGINVSMFFADLKYEWSVTDLQKDVSDINVGKPHTFFATVGIKIPL